MSYQDIANRFDYHKPDADKAAMHAAVRQNCQDLAMFFDEYLPDVREKSIATTKIEEAMFWANASLARPEL